MKLVFTCLKTCKVCRVNFISTFFNKKNILTHWKRIRYATLHNFQNHFVTNKIRKAMVRFNSVFYRFSVSDISKTAFSPTLFVLQCSRTCTRILHLQLKNQELLHFEWLMKAFCSHWCNYFLWNILSFNTVNLDRNPI